MEKNMDTNFDFNKTGKFDFGKVGKRMLHKTVWVNHIPKHLPRRPVLVHKKACQRIEDSLVELTQEKIISLRESSKLTAYSKDGRYMIDNKQIENCVRPLAIGKKNYMFCGNHDAAEEAAIMYTMMGCCKLAGVDFRKWITSS